ncbi:hypothetical protein K450DRAFT_223138 [Umbelopsis ramanniana AG]|uniref:Uncharacterized protein n=1 Tax=Umbelopsis ramanniana AG TaxID=1314678 RepID=A0AAD5HI55_UMBRA|nr:uncharacterized protein K450DRAFT_223138 [Umbelopsis ramanniana AG]KAI8583336.1 hypothetical protein K450DRAFT_223138 [Umbelopsis ramanniana AG]
MDWQRFSGLISLCCDDLGSDPPQYPPLNECAELFRQLLNALRECASVDECANQYPQAGTLLTRASLSPVLSTDETNSKLILQCLMEYTKIWQARHAPLGQQDASKRWCLTRMRRLMYGPSPADLDIDGLIHKVYSEIVTSSLIVRPRQLYDISNLSIPLLPVPNSTKLFRELISTAFDVAQRDKVSNVEEYTLSSQFIQAFLEERPDLYKTFAHMFSFQWYRCAQFVEYELVELLITVTHLPWTPRVDFDVKQLLHDGTNPDFITTMYDRPDVYRHAFRFMASIAVCSKDWRVMQILQGFHSLLFTTVAPETMDKDEMQMVFPPCSKPSQIALYFPSELQILFEPPSVTFDELNQRIEQCLFACREAYPDVRNQIWLILMMSTSLLRATTAQIINGEDGQESLSAIRLLSWLCCPSDDERLDQTESGILSWIKVVKDGKAADLRQMAECFANAKENVFNGNLNCWYHCLFWILLPHKLEDIYNCILCIVTGDLPLIQLAIWHLGSDHCPLPESIASVLIERLMQSNLPSL